MAQRRWTRGRSLLEFPDDADADAFRGLAPEVEEDSPDVELNPEFHVVAPGVVDQAPALEKRCVGVARTAVPPPEDRLDGRLKFFVRPDVEVVTDAWGERDHRRLIEMV